MKTPISYYGGKQTMLRHILPLIPQHKGYIEPFCGGAAVFFAKELADLNVINDLNEMVVNFYRVAKLKNSQLLQQVEATLYARSEKLRADIIYKNHEQYTDIEKAWAFFIESTQGFGGAMCVGWGFVSGRGINGMKRIKAYNNKQKILAQACDKLKYCQIDSIDALLCIERYDSENTFFFIDPPYPNANQGHYSGYTMDNLIQLLELLQNIKGKFMLTEYAYPEIDEYVKKNNWHYMELKLSTSAAKVNVGESRKTKTETITINYAPPQGSLF